MNNSRIDCININKPNCEYYDENRLCTNDCVGFIKKEGINNVEENIVRTKPLKFNKE